MLPGCLGRPAPGSRPVMTGDSRARSGRTVCRVPSVPLPRPRRHRRRAGGGPPGPAGGRGAADRCPGLRRAGRRGLPSASRTGARAAAGRPSPGGAAGRGSPDRRPATASVSKSKSATASCTPPIPSVREWCIFITTAAPPPSSPSTRVMLLDKARPVEAADDRQRCFRAPGRGRVRRRTAARRRCQATSKCSSVVHRGVDKLTGDLDQPLAERGNLAGRPLHPPHEIRPGGSALEPGDRHHGQAQFGLLSMYQVKASFWRINDDALIPPVITAMPV